MNDFQIPATNRAFFSRLGRQSFVLLLFVRPSVCPYGSKSLTLTIKLENISSNVTKWQSLLYDSPSPPWSPVDKYWGARVLPESRKKLQERVLFLVCVDWLPVTSTLERPVSPPPTPAAAGGMAVGTPHWSVLQVAAVLRRGARGMHNIDRLAIIPAAWGGRDETILFWRERGSRARCFQNERLYSTTPLPSRSPARVKTTSLPIMFQHFSLKNTLQYLEKANSPAHICGSLFVMRAPVVISWIGTRL